MCGPNHSRKPEGSIKLDISTMLLLYFLLLETLLPSLANRPLEWSIPGSRVIWRKPQCLWLNHTRCEMIVRFFYTKQNINSRTQPNHTNQTKPILIRLRAKKSFELVHQLVVGICCLVGEGVEVVIQEMLNGWWHFVYKDSEDLRSVSLYWWGYYPHSNPNRNSRKHTDIQSKPFLTGCKGTKHVSVGKSVGCWDFVVRLVRGVSGWFRRCWL